MTDTGEEKTTGIDTEETGTATIEIVAAIGPPRGLDQGHLT